MSFRQGGKWSHCFDSHAVYANEAVFALRPRHATFGISGCQPMFVKWLLSVIEDCV